MTKLQFTIENITPVEDQAIDKSQFSKLQVDAFSTAISAHDTFVTEDTLRKTASSILMKPFVFGVDKRLDDLSTHVPDEVPAGFVPADSKIDFKRMPDGSIMMSVEVLIWKRYSGPLLDYFTRDGGRKSVSVEIEVFDAKEDPKTGLTELLDYVYSCITALGDFIRPAIPNAQAVLQFAKEFEEAKEEYVLGFSRYDAIDFTIPAKVRKNAEKALGKYGGKGATTVALANARFMVKNEQATPERVRQVAKFFNRKNFDPDELTLGLWGGKEAAAWSKGLVDAMDGIDRKRASYFEADDFSMADLGTGKALKVNKSKEAMSERAWGEVDKGSLRNRVLEASNYKSLVKDVYALVEEGWEDAPSEHLKYPIMELKGDTLVYNRYGLSAALQRAKGQNESAVVSKVEGIYHKLGLEESDSYSESEEDKTQMAKKKAEQEETPEEEKKETPEEEKKEEEKKEEMAAPEEKPEDKKEEEKPAEEEKPEDEKKEEMAAEEEKPEEKKDDDEEFSFGFDAEGLKAMLSAEEGDGEEQMAAYAAAKEELGKGKFCDMPKVMAAMYAKMCKMDAMCKQMATEKQELAAFKASAEEEKKNFAVEETLTELASKVEIPEEKLAEMRESSKTFTFASIEDWKKECKTVAFDFPHKNEPKKETVRKIGQPFGGEDVKPKNDKWASLQK